MAKVAREVAEQEIDSWLQKKRISDKEKEEKIDSYEKLVDSMCEGILVLKPDFTFEHALLFPITNSDKEVTIETLIYLHRINDKMQEPNLKGVKIGDGDGRFNALIATLTKQNRTIISNLDTSDKKIAMAIGVFFL